jgi:hypothetical protein
MPKIFNTNKDKKRELHERFTPERMRKSIFGTTRMGDNLDERTINILFDRYKLWYNSWQKEDSEKFLLK